MRRCNAYPRLKQLSAKRCANLLTRKSLTNFSTNSPSIRKPPVRRKIIHDVKSKRSIGHGRTSKIRLNQPCKVEARQYHSKQVVPNGLSGLSNNRAQCATVVCNLATVLLKTIENECTRSPLHNLFQPYVKNYELSSRLCFNRHLTSLVYITKRSSNSMILKRCLSSQKLRNKSNKSLCKRPCVWKLNPKIYAFRVNKKRSVLCKYCPSKPKKVPFWKKLCYSLFGKPKESKPPEVCEAEPVNLSTSKRRKCLCSTTYKKRKQMEAKTKTSTTDIVDCNIDKSYLVYQKEQAYFKKLPFSYKMCKTNLKSPKRPCIEEGDLLTCSNVMQRREREASENKPEECTENDRPKLSTSCICRSSNTETVAEKINEKLNQTQSVQCICNIMKSKPCDHQKSESVTSLSRPQQVNQNKVETGKRDRYSKNVDRKTPESKCSPDRCSPESKNSESNDIDLLLTCKNLREMLGYGVPCIDKIPKKNQKQLKSYMEMNQQDEFDIQQKRLKCQRIDCSDASRRRAKSGTEEVSVPCMEHRPKPQIGEKHQRKCIYLEKPDTRFKCQGKTRNKLLMIRGTLSRSALSTIQCDMIQQIRDKRTEGTDDETEDNTKDTMIKEITFQNSYKNHSKSAFSQTQVLHVLKKFSDDFLKSDEEESPVLEQIRILRALIPHEMEEFSYSPPTTLRKKYICDLSKIYNKTFTHIENRQEIQLRNMSSEKNISPMTNNEVSLPDLPNDITSEAVTLNVTVNIPLSELQDAKKSQTLDCSALIDEVKTPQLNNYSNKKNEYQERYTTNVAPFQFDDYDKYPSSKDESNFYTPCEESIYKSNTSKYESKLDSIHLMNQPNIESKNSEIRTCLEISDAHDRHKKIKSINMHVKKILQASLKPFQLETKIDENDIKSDDTDYNTSNFQSVGNTSESYSTILERKYRKSQEMTITRIEKEKIQADNFQPTEDNCLESFPKFVQRKLEDPVTITKEKPERQKAEQLFYAFEQNEKESHTREVSPDLKGIEQQVRSKPSEEIELFSNKSKDNDNKETSTVYLSINDKQQLLEKPYDISEKDKTDESEETRTDVFTTRCDKKRFSDWREQCANINDPDDQLSCSLSELKKPNINQILDTGPNILTKPRSKKVKKKGSPRIKLNKQRARQKTEQRKHSYNNKHTSKYEKLATEEERINDKLIIGKKFKSSTDKNEWFKKPIRQCDRNNHNNRNLWENNNPETGNHQNTNYLNAEDSAKQGDNLKKQCEQFNASNQSTNTCIEEKQIDEQTEGSNPKSNDSLKRYENVTNKTKYNDNGPDNVLFAEEMKSDTEKQESRQKAELSTKQDRFKKAAKHFVRSNKKIKLYMKEKQNKKCTKQLNGSERNTNFYKEEKQNDEQSMGIDPMLDRSSKEEEKFTKHPDHRKTDEKERRRFMEGEQSDTTIRYKIANGSSKKNENSKRPKKQCEKRILLMERTEKGVIEKVVHENQKPRKFYKTSQTMLTEGRNKNEIAGQEYDGQVKNALNVEFKEQKTKKKRHYRERLVCNKVTKQVRHPELNLWKRKSNTTSHPFDKQSEPDSLNTCCSPLNQTESQCHLSREDKIAVKTAEFCKILIELVKLFSVSTLNDIKRSNCSQIDHEYQRKSI